MGDRSRIAAAWDVDKEPPGSHPVKLQHPDGDRIQAVEIVEQPTVESGALEGILERGQCLLT
jgi:hypothetical protein